MNMNFLNQIGRGLGGGIGMMGNGMSSAVNAMPGVPSTGFDLFGLGAGLRQGMAEQGLAPNTINNLMSAGKWGMGLGTLGALMGGGQGGLQGLGMAYWAAD